MEENGTDHTGQRFGRFRISTLLSWTAVAAMAMAVFSEAHITSPSDLAPSALVAFALLSATTAIPFLVDRLLDSLQLQTEIRPFRGFWQAWLVVFVGLYSMATFSLSSFAFNAEWKGSKGPSWIYYALESKAALTLWPSYFSGGLAFIVAVMDLKLATRSPEVFLMIMIQAVISFWYTFACAYMKFSHGGEFWIIPGSCAICYSLFAALIFRQRSWSLATIKAQWVALTATLVAFVAGVTAKYPLAKAYFQQLADEPPEGCFIVSAASKGHPSIVGSWQDSDSGRLVNQQLLNFWRFEHFLKTQYPTFHAGLRKVYNRVGPAVARMIVFKWQANLVYCLLKPIELLAKALIVVTSK